MTSTTPLVQTRHKHCTCAQRIVQEWCEALALLEMFFEAGALSLPDTRQAVAAKKAKVERFLAYAASCGTVTLA